MNRKVRLIAGICLLLVGAILLTLPHLSSAMLKNESQKAVNALKEFDPPQLKENSLRAVDYDFAAITSINVQDTLGSTLLGSQELFEAYRHDIIGQLIIEDLDIDLAVFNGLNNDKLLVGVSTMKANQVMGQGNFSIAGHYASGDNVLFNRLPKIQTGTVVKLTDLDTVYEYVIYKTQLVPATSLHLIENTEATQHGKPIISLMSCFYFDHPDERWFAFGELVNSYPYTPEN